MTEDIIIPGQFPPAVTVLIVFIVGAFVKDGNDITLNQTSVLQIFPECGLLDRGPSCNLRKLLRDVIAKDGSNHIPR